MSNTEPQMPSTPKRKIIFEEEVKDITSPDTCVLKMEKFNLDMAQWLQQTQPISGEEKRRIRAMLKAKTLGNQFEAKYILGKDAKYEGKGRWIVKGSIGLQGLSHDTRNALAEPYYWDVDFNNCQVEIMRQIATKQGWVHTKLDEYCENRDNIFSVIKAERDVSRDEIKQMFIRILFGGNRKLSDPEWINKEFYPEVLSIMNNLASKNPELLKKATRSKPDNPKGSCCATILQTEERKCLEALDSCLGKEGRNLAVYIHDGGYVEKLNGEKSFPEALLRNCENYVHEQTGYKLTLSVKPIITSFKLPNKAEIPEGKNYDDVKSEFELNHFRLISVSKYARTSFGKMTLFSEHSLGESYRHLKFFEENSKNQSVLKELDFIPKWIADRSIRRYEFVGMYPPPLSCPAETFNTWTGLAVEDIEPPIITEKIRLGVQSILSLIYKLCDENEEIYEYVLDYFHTAFKYPGLRVNIALLFKACSGFGKEFLFKILKACFGEKYCHISSDVERDLLGEFNSVLDGKLLVAVDEMSSKIGFKYSEKLKTLTTQTLMTINHKYGHKVSDIPNYIHWIYFADRGFPVEIESQDRRFLAVHARGNKMELSEIDTFIRIEKDMDIMRAFYDEMISREDCDNNWAVRRPNSELMNDLKTNSISRELEFVIDFCQDFGSSREVPFSELFSSYKTFLIENFSGKASETNCRSFGLSLKSLCLKGLKRTCSGGRKGTRYMINPIDVFEELKNRKVIDETFVLQIAPQKRLLKNPYLPGAEMMGDGNE